MPRRLIALFAALAWAACSCLAMAEPAQIRVKVESGVLVGRSDGGLDVFKGVPFAAPPVGPLRWAPPRPAPPWPGERDAGSFAPACPQPLRPDGPNGGGYAGGISEDCLNLNIYAPSRTPGQAKARPVLVWIYGGSNLYGANDLKSYDGGPFARDGVVLVAINYRLGVFGFFAHPALSRASAGEAVANYGLMDQIAALAWVQRNIAAFGGDPANVTVFGESAGAIDILNLMTAPAAKGLFQKAIVESGGGWIDDDSLSSAELKGEALARKAGAPAEATVEQLRALPTEALVAQTERVNPVIDGRLLRQQPEAAFAQGEAAAVPLIIGANSFEASLMSAFKISPGAYLSVVSPGVKAAYASLATDQTALAQAIFTDAIMAAPARWVARQASARAPVWLYRFDHLRANQKGQMPGVRHAGEIPYVFDTQDIVYPVAGLIDDQDRAVARTIHSCWVAFAKTGRPSCTDAPDWPAYGPTADQLMNFGDRATIIAGFRKAQWDAIEADHLSRSH